MTGPDFNSNLHAMGWYTYNNEMENSSEVAAYESGTKPVAAKQANYWGLYDMHGNVWEWCRDWSSRESCAQEQTGTDWAYPEGRRMSNPGWAACSGAELP